MKRLLIALGVAATSPMLWACPPATLAGVTPEPKIETQVVKVPVPVPCAPTLSPDPAYPDSDAALAAVRDIFEGTQLLKAGRSLRVAREGELKAALKGCEGAQ